MRRETAACMRWGAGATLDPARVVEVIGMLEPRLVIPMHYRHAGLAPELADSLELVDKFLKEFGSVTPDALDILKVSKSNRPPATQVVLLESACWRNGVSCKR